VQATPSKPETFSGSATALLQAVIVTVPLPSACCSTGSESQSSSVFSVRFEFRGHRASEGQQQITVLLNSNSPFPNLWLYPPDLDITERKIREKKSGGFLKSKIIL
jgi:hypothetical protein